MNNTENHNDNNQINLAPATMSEEDFARWGVDLAAYIKTVDVVDETGQDTGETAWAIHAADGRHLGFAETRDLAMAAVIREEMQPVSVH